MTSIYRWIAAGAGLIVAGFLVWYFHTIVLYILISAVLSLMGKPLVAIFSRIRVRDWVLPKWVAAMLTLVIIMVTFVLISRAIVPIVVEKINQLASFNMDQITGTLSGVIEHIDGYVNQFLPHYNFSVQQYITTELKPTLSSINIGNSIASATGLVMDLGMALFSVSFITYFFLKDDRLFSNGILILAPAKYEQNVRRALDSATMLLIRYFIGICIEMVIKLICITVPLYFIGFDFNTALVIGVISAVLNVIPYIGPLIGVVIGFGIAILSPIPGVSLGAVILQMTIVFGVFQLIDNIILQPYIYSSSVKADPLEIFIVILMAGYMAGVLGMLFAIPAYTVIRVFAKEFFNNFRVVQKLTQNI